MTWPLINWILSSSSSSSSSSPSSSEYDDEEFEEAEEQESPNDVVSCDQAEYDDDGVDSVTLAVTRTTDPSSSTSKRRRTDEYDPDAATVHLEEKKVSQKRVWTEEEEIELLQSFLDYTITRRTGPHQKSANSFYNDQVKPELRLRFNKSQLVEKLRRLKRKYQNTWTKLKNSTVDFRFKNPHERGIFEISEKIWSGRSSSSSIVVDHGQDNTDDNTSVEKFTRPKTRSQTRNSKRSVLDYDENETTGLIMGLALKPMSFELKFGVGDEKWREQQIMELEVYSKRLELVQGQVKAALEKLRSAPTEDNVLRT